MRNEYYEVIESATKVGFVAGVVIQIMQLKLYLAHQKYLFLGIEWLLMLLVFLLLKLNYKYKQSNVMVVFRSELMILKAALSLYFSEISRKRFTSTLDEVFFLAYCSSVVFLQWFMHMNLNLRAVFRLPLSLFNCFVYISSQIVWHAGSFADLATVKSEFDKGVSYYIVVAISSIILLELYNLKMNQQYLNRLRDIHQLIQHQSETQLILQNIRSSIITLKDDSIKFFNDAGHETLKDTISRMPNKADLDKCQQELDKLVDDINKGRNTSLSLNTPDCAQQKILEMPVLKLTHREAEQLPKHAQTTFSYKRLFELDEEQLRTMVFSKIDAPEQEQEPPLDDEEIANQNVKKHFQVEI